MAGRSVRRGNLKLRGPVGTIAALLLAACSPSPGDAAPGQAQSATIGHETHPESGLRVIPLTVATESGPLDFRVEVAETRLDQAKGLMFRTEMGEGEGMLFPLSPAREASFWMRNTVIPLDIIFVGPDRRILNIEADAVPYSEEHRVSAGKAIAVLEINGGRAAQLGIEPGDEVDW